MTPSCHGYSISTDFLILDVTMFRMNLHVIGALKERFRIDDNNSSVRIVTDDEHVEKSLPLSYPITNFPRSAYEVLRRC